MDHEEHEPKLFSLSEAESARRRVEPLLIEAMEGNREIGGARREIERHREPNHDHGRHHD